MHMITSTARRPNASTGKRQEAWRLSARACRDLACRVFECMIVLPWFTQYHFVFECSSVRVHDCSLVSLPWFMFECMIVLPWFTQYHFVFECSSAETRSLALELVFECSSAETRSLALERSSLPWFSLSSVRVHDCPAVIYPVPFRLRVFECSSAWLFAGEPAVIYVRVHDCPAVIYSVDLPFRVRVFECSSAWLFAGEPAVIYPVPFRVDRTRRRVEPVECSSAWL